MSTHRDCITTLVASCAEGHVFGGVYVLVQMSMGSGEIGQATLLPSV